MEKDKIINRDRVADIVYASLEHRLTKEIKKIISESKKGEHFWIPAIEFAGDVIKDESVKVISDGKHELFL